MDPVTIASAISWAWFIVWGTVLSIIDARTHRLPNRLVACAGAGALIGWLVLAWLGQQAWWIPLASAGAVSALLLLLHVVGGLGMGDVKYGLVIGGYLGVVAWTGSWWAVWWGLWGAFVLALPLALIRIGQRSLARHRRSDDLRGHGRTIAFGPFLTVGVVVSALGVWGVQG